MRGFESRRPLERWFGERFDAKGLAGSADERVKRRGEETSEASHRTQGRVESSI